MTMKTGVIELLRQWGGTVVLCGVILALAVIAFQAEPVPDDTAGEFTRVALGSHIADHHLERAVRLGSPGSFSEIPEQVAAEVRSMATEAKAAKAHGDPLASATLVIALRYADADSRDNGFVTLDYDGDKLLDLDDSSAEVPVLGLARNIRFAVPRGIRLAKKVCAAAEDDIANSKFCRAAGPIAG